MKIHVLFAAGLLCLSANSPAQQPVRPLQPGDTLPHLILSPVINHHQPAIDIDTAGATLTLLDFINGKCGPCFLVMPTVDSLRKEFPGLQFITVTATDDPKDLLSVINRIPVTRNVKLPIVVHDTVLNNHFPHELVSHVVWLNKHREVLAITGSDYVTRENIQLAMSGERLDWPVKRDNAFFNYQLPLLTLNPRQVVQPPFVFYSAITGFLEGVDVPRGYFVDTATATIQSIYSNLDLLTLIQISANFRTKFTRSQFKWRVKNQARFFRPPDVALSDWQRANSVTYTIRVPLETDLETLAEIIKADLRKWLLTLGIKVTPILRKNKNGPSYEIQELNYH